jgi:hypothetical protein
LSLLDADSVDGDSQTASITPAAASGSVTTTGVQPGGTEIYALKLRGKAGAISASDTALLSGIVADINGQNGNPPPLGVTASLVTGAYSSEFPGYDILLTSNSGFTSDGTSQLSFDFSSLAAENADDAGLAVTGVAAAEAPVSAVPEPTALLCLVVSSAGALLSRRKRRHPAN